MLEPTTSFGSLIRRRRKALDLTQQELAARVNCSAATIRKIENDERRPSRQIAELIAKVLEVPAAEQAEFIRVARAHKSPLHLSLHNPLFVTPSRRQDPLPQPMTIFLGREQELHQLGRLLTSPESRLITLLGPGGIGKTRLAIEAARSISTYQRKPFRDGFVFVSLEAVSTGSQMLVALAEALGLPLSPDENPGKLLSQFLRDKQMLFILDNMEQVEGGSEKTGELLRHAGELKVLATSRSRLNLHGEWVVEIQGFPVPLDWTATDLVESSAVQLFLQSAKHLKEDFPLTAQNAESIARICRLVEGIPLGIEMAAAWVHVLPVEVIAQEIEKDLDFLTYTSTSDIPERQRSMRAVFDSSWRMLSSEEKATMRRLAVFRGGFERHAAAQVAGARLPILARLIEKTLLRRAVDGRYYSHELVRQFAQAQLQQDDEEYKTWRSRHSEYYLEMFEENLAGLEVYRKADVVAALTRETDNIRAAWEWSIQQDTPANEPGASTRIERAVPATSTERESTGF